MIDQEEIDRLEVELQTIRDAITAILTRGQSVGTGGRSLSRADLRWLRTDEATIERKLKRLQRGGIPLYQMVPRG